MPIKYDTETTPPEPDGRADYLPRPAVNLAQRLAQLARDSDFVLAHVVISKGEWNLQIECQNERLGNG